MNLLFSEGKRELFILLILLILTKNEKMIIFLLFALLVFFRAPPADFKDNKHEILSPSYGTVSSIESLDIGTKINILLNVSDVHVQYAPYTGVVKETKHIDGRLNPFFLVNVEKTDNNERMYTVLNTDIGQITIIQYAGMIARRIVNDLKNDQFLEKGQIFGMIKFSSRVDIIIPNKFKVQVKKGDKLKGGITILAI